MGWEAWVCTLGGAGSPSLSIGVLGLLAGDMLHCYHNSCLRGAFCGCGIIFIVWVFG